MKEKLSSTMERALSFASDNGGKIKRYPGGFWGQNGLNTQQPWFGTPTIQALVSRGYFEYSDWTIGATRFPIEVSLVPDPRRRATETENREKS